LSGTDLFKDVENPAHTFTPLAILNLSYGAEFFTTLAQVFYHNGDIIDPVKNAHGQTILHFYYAKILIRQMILLPSSNGHKRFYLFLELLKKGHGFAEALKSAQTAILNPEPNVKAGGLAILHMLSEQDKNQAIRAHATQILKLHVPMSE
jgi:hypothetical protein